MHHKVWDIFKVSLSLRYVTPWLIWLVSEGGRERVQLSEGMRSSYVYLYVTYLLFQ